MSKVFPAILNNHNGSSTGHKLTFLVQPEHAEALTEMATSGIGKAYLVVAYEIEAEESTINSLHNQQQTEEQQLRKKMFGMMGQYGEIASVDQRTVKFALKQHLIAEGHIEESLSELTSKTYPIAIWLLQTKLNPQRYDYEQHTE